MTGLLKVKKMPHESFQKYAMRWRLEASKIHPPLPEDELISTFIQIQEGLYFDKLFGACACNFSDLIRIGKEIENGIQEGKYLEEIQVVHPVFQPKTLKNPQSLTNSAFVCQFQCHQSHKFSQSLAFSNL